MPGVDSGARVELHDVSADVAHPNRYLVAFIGGLGLADESVNLFHNKRRQNTENVCVERRKRSVSAK